MVTWSNSLGAVGEEREGNGQGKSLRRFTGGLLPSSCTGGGTRLEPARSYYEKKGSQSWTECHVVL